MPAITLIGFVFVLKKYVILVNQHRGKIQEQIEGLLVQINVQMPVLLMMNMQNGALIAMDMLIGIQLQMQPNHVVGVPEKEYHVLI